MRHILNEDDCMVKTFGGVEHQRVFAHDVDIFALPLGTAFKLRSSINHASFLSVATTPLRSRKPLRSGLCDIQPDLNAHTWNKAKRKDHQSTSFFFFSKKKSDEEKAKEAQEKYLAATKKAQDKPESYCCKGYKDASETCTGYRVDRGCMADFLDNPGFKKVKSKAEDFAESSKPTYCCKRGSTFCLGGIRVKHEELEGTPPVEGRVGGSSPISTSDIVENAQNCIFKHNKNFRGCRYRDVNIGMPDLPPQGKNFQKCDGPVPQLPSRKSRGEEDDCKDGKDADGNDCKEEDDFDKECKNGKDADGKKCKEPEIEDQRNIDDGKEPDKDERFTPEENKKQEKAIEEKIKKEQKDADEEAAESNEQREIELMAQEEVRPHLPPPPPEDVEASDDTEVGHDVPEEATKAKVDSKSTWD